MLVWLCFVAFVGTALAGDVVLLPYGSFWRFLDDGSDQGTEWLDYYFYDEDWPGGYGQFGYGDFDEETYLSFGPDEDDKYITTYFRVQLEVANPQSFIGAFKVRAIVDDGAIFYMNGVEVFRYNMPEEGSDYLTGTETELEGGAESTPVEFTIPKQLFYQGWNVLAVEVHQYSATSPDLSFDLELSGSRSDVLGLSRGPYLQMGTPTSAIVQWRTDIATNSLVRFGRSVDDLSTAVFDSAATTDHRVTLRGLTPNTTYFYSIATGTQTLVGGADYFFVTAPRPGTRKPTRIWAIGDAGTTFKAQLDVRDAYGSFTGSRYTDVWLMLGDNAYYSGLDSEYQAAVFNVYQKLLRQTFLWSTIGNHETGQSPNPPPTIPYYQIFTLPQNGEAGGVPSGTEDYYSFDYANIHFVCLDSMTSQRTGKSPMLEWLKADLAANTQDWLIAFWHHPPYTKGSHNSDFEIEHIEMRQNAVPILESYGVDVVLGGHSHSYERSFLIDGHYGYSLSFDPSMLKDAGNGRTNGTGPYLKSAGGPVPHQGAIYIVDGSSGGQGAGGFLNHPVMFFGRNLPGSVVLDIDGNRLDAVFIRDTGLIEDSFTMIKGAPPRLKLAGHPGADSPIRLFGLTGKTYVLQATTNFVDWVSLRTNTIPVDTFDFSDGEASDIGKRFYRVKQVAP
jgi:hypothetical protein